MLHRLLITLVWVVVVTLGYVSYVFYTSTRQDQTPIFARVEQYQDDWHKAINNVKTTPPPSLEEFVRKAPVWQRTKLRKQLGPLDEQHQTDYRKQAEQLVADLRNEFIAQWDEALANFGDTPLVTQVVEAFHPVHQEHYHLLKTMTHLDETQKKRHPRTRLALDSFSGYCVFRRPEFRKRLQDKRLHLVDDGARYADRMKGLRDGMRGATRPNAHF